ncbi:MAG: YIP1 family protein [Anaerolineaceae bacterium]|nr:YIP1 family protein [Anaerolineaceae bacterium]
MDRFIKAFTFKQEVYKEVEEDASFTPTAWMIVAVVSFLSQMGSNAALVHVEGASWVFGTIVGTVFAVAGFAVGAFVISWAGKTFFNADVTFEEMVRTLGLAYVWNIIGFLGIIGLLSSGLVCVTGPISFIAGIAGLVAWFIAAKEALDLEWPQTIGTVVIGWVASLIISLIATAMLGVFGIAGAGIGTALRGLR